jgi:hypothetical protein
VGAGGEEKGTCIMGRIWWMLKEEPIFVDETRVKPRVAVDGHELEQGRRTRLRLIQAKERGETGRRRSNDSFNE